MHLADKATRKPPELSGGERQRVALARALANDPKILLADEPTGSLDPASVQQTLDLFEHLRAETGITILMVTHDRDVAAAADRVVNLEAGHVSSSTSCSEPSSARSPRTSGELASVDQDQR